MGMLGKNEALKRSACAIAAQLPEDKRDALCVLNYAREIVANLGKSWEIQSALPEAKSVRLVYSDASPQAPFEPE